MQWIIDSSWRDALLFEWQHPRYRQLEIFVDEEYSRHECYPPKERIFEAFRLCPFQDTKVVILGQDPYHGEGEFLLAAFISHFLDRCHKGFHDVRLDIRFARIPYVKTEQGKDDILDGYRNPVLVVRRVGMLNDVRA